MPQVNVRLDQPVYDYLMSRAKRLKNLKQNKYGTVISLSAVIRTYLDIAIAMEKEDMLNRLEGRYEELKENVDV